MKEYYDFSLLTFEHFLRKNGMTKKYFSDLTGVTSDVIYRADKNKRISKEVSDKIAKHFDIYEVFSPELSEEVVLYFTYVSFRNGKCVDVRINENRFHRYDLKGEPQPLGSNFDIVCDGFASFRGHIIADSLKDAMQKICNFIEEEEKKYESKVVLQ